jgi:hypothetical protein
MSPSNWRYFSKYRKNRGEMVREVMEGRKVRKSGAKWEKIEQRHREN